MVHFTKHAEEKFEVLARHGVMISRQQVIDAVESPDVIDDASRKPLCIAQADLDDTHVLRVVYRQEEEVKFVITFYPGRKQQYAP